MDVGWPLVLVVTAVLVPFTAWLPFRDVSRGRLARFARRQALTITADNGMRVIAYLATTRRWRSSGLVLALFLDVAYSATLSRENLPHVTGAAVFAGWFIGAVAAEWRIATIPVGERRMASLHQRRLGDYVARPALVIAAVAWVVVAGAALLAAADTMWQDRPLRYYRQIPGSLWTELALLALTGAALGLVTYRVLRRPQPLAPPDVLAADDAMRRHSLNMLIGSAVALAGYLGAAVVSAFVLQGPGSGYQLSDALEFVGVVVLPAAGALIALGPRRRAARVPAIPVSA
jgi:hypothetical protein